jgi:hypothetical protein
MTKTDESRSKVGGVAKSMTFIISFSFPFSIHDDGDDWYSPPIELLT